MEIRQGWQLRVDGNAMKATVCRIFGTRRSTLVDSLTRIGWVFTSGETRLMRRQQLSEAQIAALFDPPTDRRELVRHCTLSEADTAMIRRCRGDHSRLGYALMLCYLRYPRRPLRINERPPAALISFVAEPRHHRLARGRRSTDHLLAHLSPLGWEHLNLTGDYVWSRADQRTVNADGYRPLRMASEAALPAA